MLCLSPKSFLVGADANTYINICSNYGSNLIKEIDLEIGGQLIDKHYSHWHSVYSQLTEFNPTGVLYQFPQLVTSATVPQHYLLMVLKWLSPPVLTAAQITLDLGWCYSSVPAQNIYPFIFLVLYNPGLALPIALQYH